MGIITANGDLFISESNIIKVKDEFRKYLIPFRQFTFDKFSIKKDGIKIHLTKTYPEVLDYLLEKSTDEVKFNYDRKTNTITITKKVKEETKNNQKKDDKQTDDVKDIIVTKKLTNINPGKYRIKFKEPEVQWVLIVTESGKRIPVKNPNEIVETEEKIKSITPINNRKHKK